MTKTRISVEDRHGTFELIVDPKSHVLKLRSKSRDGMDHLSFSRDYVEDFIEMLKQGKRISERFWPDDPDAEDIV